MCLFYCLVYIMFSSVIVSICLANKDEYIIKRGIAKVMSGLLNLDLHGNTFEGELK